VGERGLRDPGDKAVRRALALVELHLKKRDLRDRALFGQGGGELEQVRGHKCLGPDFRQEREDQAGDLLALGRVRARAELVEEHHRSRLELLEHAANPDELHPELPLRLIGPRLLQERHK
jgi:hypothetical protein